MEERNQNGIQMAETGLGSSSIKIEIKDIQSASKVSQIHVSQGCLTRVHEKLRSVRDTDFLDRYSPQIVSIGPYHHGKANLKFNDYQKKMYLDSLGSRSRQSGVSMNELVAEIRPLEEEARDYYAEPISFTSDEFVTMMVLDGCFILEILYRSIEDDIVYETDDLAWGEDEMPKSANANGGDNASRRGWIETSSLAQNMIIRDLVLLENQIPLIVLKGLFTLTKHPEHPVPLNHLLKHYFNPIMPTEKFLNDDTIQGKHLLDVLRKFLLPSHRRRVEQIPNDPRGKYNIPNAKRLFHSGVTFKLNAEAEDLFDISFKDGMVIEIPTLYYGEGTMILLRNLVALEQCCPNYRHQITSYVILMSFLVQSKADVKLLSSEGIIDGAFEHYKKMATEIHGLSEGISASPFYYHGSCNQLNATLRRRWVRWRARVTREHISNLPPWAIYTCFVSLLTCAGGILQFI